MTLDKAAVLAAIVVRPVPFDLPGFGTIYLRPWDVGERLAFREWVGGVKDNLPAVYRRMVAASVCDADGKLLFADADLVAMSGASAEAIAGRVNEINRIGATDPKKDTSPEGPTARSPSGSPGT
jgi:hypothetical protein